MKKIKSFNAVIIDRDLILKDIEELEELINLEKLVCKSMSDDADLKAISSAQFELGYLHGQHEILNSLLNSDSLTEQVKSGFDNWSKSHDEEKMREENGLI